MDVTRRSVVIFRLEKVRNESIKRHMSTEGSVLQDVIMSYSTAMYSGMEESRLRRKAITLILINEKKI